MAKRRKTTSPPTTRGKSAWAQSVNLLGKPVLLPSEDSKQFHRIFEAVAADIKPIGAMELVLVRDIVTLIFDENRLRRLKLLMLKCGQDRAGMTQEESFADQLQFHMNKHVQLEQMIGSIQNRRNETRWLLTRLREVRAKKEAMVPPPVDAVFTELPPIQARQAPLALAAP